MGEQVLMTKRGDLESGFFFLGIGGLGGELSLPLEVEVALWEDEEEVWVVTEDASVEPSLSTLEKLFILLSKIIVLNAQSGVVCQQMKIMGAKVSKNESKDCLVFQI